MATFRSPGNSSGQPGGSTFLDRVISAVSDFAGQLRKAVTNDDIVTVKIGTADTVVRHGLGAPPVSWEVVDNDTGAAVWRSQPVTNTTITLRASAPVTVKLRFN